MWWRNSNHCWETYFGKEEKIAFENVLIYFESLHLIKWEDACRSQKNGGLGLGGMQIDLKKNGNGTGGFLKNTPYGLWSSVANIGLAWMDETAIRIIIFKSQP